MTYINSMNQEQTKKDGKVKKQDLENLGFELGADKMKTVPSVKAYKALFGFFYAGDKTAADYAKRVTAQCPGAEVLSFGRKDFPFKGGAPVEKQSHFYVLFKMAK